MSSIVPTPQHSKPPSDSSMTETMCPLKSRGYKADFEYANGAFHVSGSEHAFRENELIVVEHGRT